MIVKASNALRRTVFAAAASGGPKMIPIPGKAEVRQDLPELIPLIPDWLRLMLIDGSVLVMDREEYYDLPVEVQAELEVYSR